jgi:hypothetical protein
MQPRHAEVEPELAGEILPPRPGEQEARPRRGAGGEAEGAARGALFTFVEQRRGGEEEAVVEGGVGQAVDDLAVGGIGAAVAQPAGHADETGAPPVAVERLAQPEHAGGRRDAAQPPARILRRGDQTEEPRVGENSSARLDPAGHPQVGRTVCVEIHRDPIEVDHHVAIPGQVHQPRPVVPVDAPHRRARILRIERLVRPDVLQGALARRGSPRPRPAPGIHHARQEIEGSGIHRRRLGRRLLARAGQHGQHAEREPSPVLSRLAHEISSISRARLRPARV